MLSFTLNPGFVLMAAALAMLAAPASARSAIMAGAAAIAMWLLLYYDFSAISVTRQMRLEVVLLKPDALNQVFGIAFIASLMLLALYSSTRRNRWEDAAILMLAGGATTALFVGDLLSFVAFAAVAGLAATWVVFASPLPGSNPAGVRLLIWHGLEGLLFIAGMAFQLSAGAAKTEFTRLDIHSIGGAFIFAALMIRVGAPLAHVWLKDVTAHASGPGATALSAFTVMFGVYALARMFSGEPVLVPIGVAMMLIGAAYAMAEDDLRRAAASAMTAQTGVCVALVGVGTPMALAGASAHAFTAIFSFALVQMALGAYVTQRGSALASEAAGASKAMPATTFLLLLGGVAAAGVPFFSPYISFAVVYEAATQWSWRGLWMICVALSAATFVAVALRPVLSACMPPAKRPAFSEASFPMLLAMALAAFFLIAVGLSPDWLYRLVPPNGIAFDPYRLHRMAPQLELLGAAGLAYIALRVVRLAQREQPLRLRDVDAFYRGPIAGAGNWLGVVLLRVLGAAQAASERAGERGGRALANWARSCDRPYADGWAGAAQFAAIAALLALILIAQR